MKTFLKYAMVFIGALLYGLAIVAFAWWVLP